MSFKTAFSRLMARMFSLDNEGTTPEVRAKRFVIQLAAWMLVARIVLAVWAIVYPDSRFFSSLDALSIAPRIEIWIDGALKSIPANDSYFYWIISIGGVLGNPEYSPSLVNFSQVFPAILAAVRLVFSTWSPYIVNTAFAMTIPWFLVSFLNHVIKSEATARRVVIVILFNPIFLAYSIYGLTEPLHYLLLFAALSAHYKTGMAWRLVEYASVVILVLNRFIAVVLAVFYVYKAIFIKGVSLKQRIILFIPVAIMGATYIGWEWLCKTLFGLTPSEARSTYWHHGFNLNPLSPGFMVNQAPLLLAGALLGLLVLVSTFSKNGESRDLEAKEFSRVDTQALVAVGAMTFIFLGLQNEPISVLRYTGTAFPLFAVMMLRVPTSKLLPVASFGVATGMVASHLITTVVIFTTNPPIPSFTSLDLILCSFFTILFIVTSIAFFLKRHVAKSDNWFMFAQLLLAFLVVPLSLYFP